MGAMGVNHKYRLNETSQFNTTVAGTYNGIDSHQNALDDNLAEQSDNIIRKNNYNLVLNSFMNNKNGHIGNRRTGIVVTGMFYDMSLKNADGLGGEMKAVANERGNSALIEAYTELESGICGTNAPSCLFVRPGHAYALEMPSRYAKI